MHRRSLTSAATSSCRCPAVNVTPSRAYRAQCKAAVIKTCPACIAAGGHNVDDEDHRCDVFRAVGRQFTYDKKTGRPINFKTRTTASQACHDKKVRAVHAHDG